MGVAIKPSDLQFRYHRKKGELGRPGFQGKPDMHPFDREDLYEVIPMLEAVMNALQVDDARLLHQLENLIDTIPIGYAPRREDIFDFLVEQMRDLLE